MKAMTTALAVQPKPQQQSFDYSIVPSTATRVYMRERELLIREHGKRTAVSIVEIGRCLTEVKARLIAEKGQGHWLPWLERCFDWSDRTARNFVYVYQAFKTENFSNLEIDVSALYLLAARKTPAPVREEALQRAQHGEPITHAKAQELLQIYKSRAELPPTPIARQIATATGLATADRTGVYRMPGVSAAEERAAQQKLTTDFEPVRRIRELFHATKRDPKQLSEELPIWGCVGLDGQIPLIVEWLNHLMRGLQRSGKLQPKPRVL